MDDKNLKSMRKLSRENRLQREKLVGKTRAESWGGKPSNKKARQKAKKELKNLD